MNVRRVTGVSVVAIVLGAVLSAQANSFVVPSKAQLRQPGLLWGDLAEHWWPSGFFSGPLRLQYLYDATDVPLASGSLRGIAFRGVGGMDWGSIPTSFATNLRVSTSPRTPVTSSAVFAWNTGPDDALVFSGTVNLGLNFMVPWPAPWESTIPFAQPFPWTRPAQGSLLVDFDVTQTSSFGSPWIPEALRAEFGNAWLEHRRFDCFNGNANPSVNYRIEASALVPGGSLNLWLFNYPPDGTLAINALLFGARGAGAFFGNFITPFSLDNLGLPARPNCDWAIGDLFDMGIPMTHVAQGRGSELRLLGLPIPNDPNLVGAGFYTQDIALEWDPFLSTQVLFPSLALRWKIGSGATIPCTTIAQEGRVWPNGQRLTSEALVLRVDY
ncbi:MAG: hypothetical protein HZB39_02925 [Planctomycetes bacterium]|nr:hypothetical protein [Planctomycetota bacterium]